MNSIFSTILIDNKSKIMNLTKFENFNSPELSILKEHFNSFPMMETYIANIIESYIYSNKKEYYKNGPLWHEYRTKYGVKDGKYKEWHVNGQLYKEWYDNGQMAEKCTYIDGKKNGKFNLWYNNGQIWEESRYINDEIRGDYKKWYRTGQLWEQNKYINEKNRREEIWWSEEGVILQHNIYENDILIKHIIHD